jgi:hypothetical protein
MIPAWADIAAGILFCIAGIWLFQRLVFDRNRELWKPVLLLVIGVLLIAAGSAKNVR